MIRALIWDADGTLFDSYPPIYKSIEVALAVFDITVARSEIVRLTQIDMPTCFTELARQHRLDETDLLREYHNACLTYSSAGSPLFPGLRAQCQSFLARGGQHFILTHRDRLTLMALLDHNGCAGWFSDIVTEDDGFPRKPDPTSLLVLMERNALEKKSVMYVGDRELDIKAARNAGILACQFGNALTNTEPDIRINTYDKLDQALMLYNE